MYRKLIASLVFAIPLILPCAVGAGDGRSHDSTDALGEFLSKYLSIAADSKDNRTSYVAAFVDLNDDGTMEVLVHVSGPHRCGSGGCNTLILSQRGNGYRVVSNVTITRLPIRVLKTKTNGWHDIGVWVQGGGIQPGHEARLRFNGRQYPGNPTVAPAQKLNRNVDGDAVLTAASPETLLNP